MWLFSSYQSTHPPTHSTTFSTRSACARSTLACPCLSLCRKRFSFSPIHHNAWVLHPPTPLTSSFPIPPPLSTGQPAHPRLLPHFLCTRPLLPRLLLRRKWLILSLLPTHPPRHLPPNPPTHLSTYSRPTPAPSAAPTASPTLPPSPAPSPAPTPVPSEPAAAVQPTEDISVYTPPPYTAAPSTGTQRLRRA